MLDGSKVGRTSLHHFAHLSDFTDVILTDDVSADIVAEISEHAAVHLAVSSSGT
jgi:DeoR/GlpR family transcriptional regulator of sugar metabolism